MLSKHHHGLDPLAFETGCKGSGWSRESFGTWCMRFTQPGTPWDLRPVQKPCLIEAHTEKSIVPIIEDLIEQAVRLSLHALRAKATPGAMSGVINRTTGRILNPFEENRMQSRIFTSVQNIGTMDRYAAQWSDLLLFLLKLVESNASCYTLSIRYLRHLPIIGDCMKRIQTLERLC